MQYYKYEVTCINGGWGWGDTGDRRFMCAHGKDIAAADKRIAKRLPGGWVSELLGPTDDTYYITAQGH